MEYNSAIGCTPRYKYVVKEYLSPVLYGIKTFFNRLSTVILAEEHFCNIMSPKVKIKLALYYSH